MTILLNVAARPLIPMGTLMINHFSTKMMNLIKRIFNVLQWSFVSLYGAKEILFDRVTDIRRNKKSLIQVKAHFVNQSLNQIFLKKASFLGPIKYHIAHGSLYMASGLAGSLAAMHKAGWVNAGAMAFPLEVIGNGIFAFASMVALVQNVRIYRAASKVSSLAPLHECEAASMLKKSSVLGIISSLNYIVAAALLMIGPAAAFALVFGCIAVTTGCIKILYDFIRFRNAY